MDHLFSFTMENPIYKWMMTGGNRYTYNRGKPLKSKCLDSQRSRHQPTGPLDPPNLVAVQNCVPCRLDRLAFRQWRFPKWKSPIQMVYLILLEHAI